MMDLPVFRLMTPLLGFLRSALCFQGEHGSPEIMFLELLVGFEQRYDGRREYEREDSLYRFFVSALLKLE